MRSAVARHEGWPDEGVVVTPGSNMLVLALASGARSVLDTAPSFTYYKGGAAAEERRIARSRSATASRCPSTPSSPRWRARRACCSCRTRTHPPASCSRRATWSGSPRGARERGWLLVVDEAYHAFAGSDARPLARANPNVAILRTFSKSWCLGGIRSGYLLASPRVATIVRALVPPFCVPAHTAAILLTALESPGAFAPIHERIRAERARLLAGLASHATWKPYPSAANYLLVRTPDAKAAFDALVARGIIVRRQDHYPGLEGCLRITVGTREENDALLAAVAGLTWTLALAAIWLAAAALALAIAARLERREQWALLAACAVVGGPPGWPRRTASSTTTSPTSGRCARRSGTRGSSWTRGTAPAMMLLYAPAARFGLVAARLTSIIPAAIALSATVLASRALGQARPWLAAALLASQYDFFGQASSTMTELLFAAASR